MRKRNSEEGSSIVELALCMPLLVLILLAAADFGRIMYKGMELTAAARAGALYGASSMANSTNSAEIRNAAANAAANIGLTADATDIPEAGQYPVCASDDSSAATFAYQSSPATCASSCSGTSHMVCYVKVRATKSFTVLSSFLPASIRTVTLTRTAYQVVR